MIEKNPILEGIKNVISTAALLWSIALVGGLIINEQTGLSKDVHPALAAILLIFTVIWLSVVEGGQASLVGLTPVNNELYKDTHKIAYKCTQITNTGDGLDRYLLGRQFMVVLDLSKEPKVVPPSSKGTTLTFHWLPLPTKP